MWFALSFHTKSNIKQAEQFDFNRVWELIILAAFRKWLGANRAKGLLPLQLALID